jgi:hypothetical protein
MEQCSDLRSYWPGGLASAAVMRMVIFTAGIGRDEPVGGRLGESLVERGEIQVWADGVRGIAQPKVKSDIVVIDGAPWRVMEKVETVGGMHRLGVEKMGRSVVGGGRGDARARR